MIAADRVGVRAGATILLAEVSIEVHPGRILAVLGPNGAGKSTLLDVLAGGRTPHSGQVTLGGRPIASWSALELARMRAVLPQSTQLGFDFTVAEVVALGRQPFAGTRAMRHDAAALRDAASQLGIDALWHRAFPGLSGGEQQRVHMARVLAQLWQPQFWQPQIGQTPGDTPRYLLLDEPTSALDLRHRRIVLDAARNLARQGACVLAVLHDLNLAAEYADDAVLLQAGRVQMAGPADQVLTAAALEACFGVGIEELTRKDGSRVFVA